MAERIENQLAELEQDVKQCNSCALRNGCQNVVFGEGFPGLMVIGEGPGAEEDRLGRPFVGAAGQLLDKILAAGGYDRQRNAYIANVVKCRPPGNRIPTPEERTACLPYLKKQIGIVKPSIILLLGATAFQSVMDTKEGITKARGRWIEQDGLYYMPTFHPAALLRDPRRKVEVWEDMKKVVALYREKVDPEHQTPFV